MKFITNSIASLKKYSFLIEQLVTRDFKVKYKRSVLGIAWSLLYPILMMTVMTIIFSNFFKFTTPGVSYPAYLLIGITYFNYFSEASNLAMSTIVGNFGLINKVYLPKYVFPLTKCLFVGINFLLSMIPLYLILFISDTGLCWQHIFLPYSFLCLFMFTLGMGLLLSALTVFLRDMLYIYGIIIQLWTYLTPLFYDLSIIDNPIILALLKLNPMYQYVTFARAIMLYHETPAPELWFGCAVSAILVLVIGTVVFRKNQDKFVYYL